MTEYLTADALIAIASPEDDLVLPGVGTVRLRGLSRAALFANGKGTEDSNVIETRNLISCLVEPKLTREQAEAFMKAAPAGTAGLISNKIRELSGLAEGAAKSDVDQV